MAEETHKYMCVYCKRYLFENTTASLARTVNAHNQLMHPMDFANWTASGIVLSTCYSGASGPLPQYLAPYADRKLTEADKVFLAEARVKW